MGFPGHRAPGRLVAPLAGSVDRNTPLPRQTGGASVAPLAGSVDRNDVGPLTLGVTPVAPLAGSVDRNGDDLAFPVGQLPSLPSRGAWIEIPLTAIPATTRPKVAPLAGSVDRNG